ncbi:MAG: efflux RND transporter periplasmic adaptor subunit [Eubacteriales bacterium]|nr:efflux RND transporter periplasmic adaptor subunit [Eubacteriales bacterium]MDD3350681.1 efflux RND transporter periplasmic adaptor subunit [Eubacteriales bacterium]
MFFRGKKKESGKGEMAADFAVEATEATQEETAEKPRFGKEKSKLKGKSKKKKRIIIGTIVVLLIAAVVIVPKALGSGPVMPTVNTGTVSVMDVEEVVSIKGTISGSVSADVASSSNYEITSILVKEGDVVAKDQLLATLDAKDLEREAQKAAKTLADSKFAYDSSKSLYEQGALSEKEYLSAKHAYESDQISLRAFDVDDKANIRSPIAGTVTRVNVNLGQYANDTESNEPMFVIEDLENLKMDVKISEYDISKIKVGQKVTITAEMLGDTSVSGVVSQISPTGEKKDTTTTEMVIPVKIDVIKGDSGLIAGVTAKAKIEIQKKSAVLAIPIDSILEDPASGDSYVFKLDGTVLKKVIVTLGVEGDFNTELVSGELKDGDQVVLSPTFDLADGMEVLSLTQ